MSSLPKTPPLDNPPAPVNQGPERPDISIDWHIPEQPAGWRGSVARFFGPGQSRAEATVQIVGLAVCAALLSGYLWQTLPSLHPALAWWQVLILALIGFDLIGGVLTNATGAAKRWYHRPGTRRSRLIFTASHVAYLIAVGFLVLDGNWLWVIGNTIILYAGAVAIEWAPLEIRRPIAGGWVLLAVLLNLILLPIPLTLAWFVPFFYLKLLLFHQVPEAPLAASAQQGTAA